MTAKKPNKPGIPAQKTRHGAPMSKDTMISFRTTVRLSASLKKMAAQNGTTLSGFIDAVLDEYLNSPAARKILDQDRRKFSRQNENIPALVERGPDAPLAARITSLSLGGVSLTLSGEADPGEFSPGRQFDVVFSLPRGRRPVTIHCQISWAAPASDVLQIGAVFHDADPDSYQTLLGYLS